MTPTRPSARRVPIGRIGAIVALVLLGVATVAYFARQPLLQAALDHGSVTWAGAPVAMDIVSVNRAGITLADVRLLDGRIVAEQASVGIDWQQVASIIDRPEAMIASIAIDGVTAIWDVADPTLANALRLNGSGSNPRSVEGQPPTDLPRMSVTNAAIRVSNAPIGDAVVRVEGLLQPDFAAGTRLAVRLDSAAATASIDIAPATDARAWAVSMQGKADLETPALAPYRPSLGISRGRVDIQADGVLAFPNDPADPSDWLFGASHAAATLTIGELRHDALPGIHAVHLPLHARSGGGRVEIGLSEPATVHAAGVDLAALTGLTVAASEAPDTWTIELAQNTLVLARQPVGEGYAATLDTWATARPLTRDVAASSSVTAAASFRAELPLTADFAWHSPADFTFEVTAHAKGVSHPSGSVDDPAASIAGTGRVSPGGAADVAGSMDVAAERLAAEHGSVANPSLRATYKAIGPLTDFSPSAWSIDAPQIALSASAFDALPYAESDTPLQASLSATRLSRGELSTNFTVTAGAAAAMPSDPAGRTRIRWQRLDGAIALDAAGALGGDVTASGVVARPSAGDVRFRDGEIAVSLSDRTIAVTGGIWDDARPARFRPLALNMTGQLAETSVAVDGAISGHRGRARLPFRGQGDFANRRGTLALGPATLRFQPDRMQLTDILPTLGRTHSLRGTVKAAASLRLGATGRATGSGSVTLEQVDARTPEGQVEQLSGRIEFVGIPPVEWQTPQALRAASLTVGVPLSSVSARLSAQDRRDGLHIHIAEAGATLADGRLTVADARLIDGHGAVDIAAKGIDLAQLLRDWQVEGVSGDGRLSGRVPLRLGPAGAAIANGELRAEGPGKLRVDWGSARSTLASAGSQVELMLRALEDFHYKALTIGLDRPAGGEVRLLLGLDGANPTVLENHPFRFNINLSGRPEPILAAIRQGQSLGADLLQGGLSTFR